MRSSKYIFALVLSLVTQLACTMHSDLPRNMNLKAFDPHRASFRCKHEAEVVPPVDPEAQQWFLQAMAVTSYEKRESDRDHKVAAELWQKAADRKHWKAMINLANAYAHGEGVEYDSEKAVLILEKAMKLGIPAAYDAMGTYHMEGLGVKQDASRAYAFWQLAADMGSPNAMAYLGSKLQGVYDDPQSGFWGNRTVAFRMLECGFSQGNGQSAYELGVILDGKQAELGEDYVRALKVFHEGVKFGNADCAGWLSGSFRSGEPMVNGIKDIARADRYSRLGDALLRNPDLRLPNLDKVLPLPPADLPKWDGEKKTLVDAAKPLAPALATPSTPGAQRTGRAHIPDGYVLPPRALPPQDESAGWNPDAGVAPQYEATAARYSGYWLAQLLEDRDARSAAWNRAQVPQRYAQREAFESDRKAMGLSAHDGRLMWHYVGVPFPRAEPRVDPRIAQGIARSTVVPEYALTCAGDVACPKTGVWSASIPKDHPSAARYNRWDRQSYVTQGQEFPNPESSHLHLEPGAVTWLWLGNANESGFGGVAYVSLSRLGAEGANA
ncbi:DUF6396 domain-containing protein [Variovorax boronicumulans]|jgi:hypothetical protein|uniref:SEL1-like repeat protein n=1 Tax=Variovorax boronicumulans TaxID=436515 RepID=UPI002CB0D2C4|nr:DUF6396 domain-containing protein [Burkholderiaceae bacterium]